MDGKLYDYFDYRRKDSFIIIISGESSYGVFSIGVDRREDYKCFLGFFFVVKFLDFVGDI